MNFIEMILLLHKANVNKFSIHFTPQIDQSRLHTWIKAVLNHNVQDIDIDGYFRMHLRLPRSLFNCDTLVKLKLGTYLELDIPTSIHFPCLKVLDVSLHCPSNDLTRKLFRSCPVLEKLKIDISPDSGELIYNISSPALKKLSLSISTLDVENFDSVVEVDAPLLESLTVVDFCFAHYIMKNSSSLVRARVTVAVVDEDNQVLDDSLPVDRLITLLKSVSNVDNLFLGGRFPVAVFSSASESNWPMFSNVTCLELDVCESFDNDGFSRWPTFPKLTHMKLDVYEDFASKNMSNLLMLVPNLVSMVLHKVSSGDNSKMFNSNEQVVPSCFRSCLREIEVLQFDGWKSDLNLMKYLLANTKVVEKITVQFQLNFATLNHIKQRSSNRR